MPPSTHLERLVGIKLDSVHRHNVTGIGYNRSIVEGYRADRTGGGGEGGVSLEGRVTCSTNLSSSNLSHSPRHGSVYGSLGVISRPGITSDVVLPQLDRHVPCPGTRGGPWAIGDDSFHVPGRLETPYPHRVA